MNPSPGHYNPNRRLPVIIIVSVIIVVTGVTGCSVFSPIGDFIGQRYENTVAYFNTYYNASTAFNDAESEVIKQQQTLRAKDQPIKLGEISSSAKQKFDISIEKLSRLLTFYPTSKWVDRSLVMIGKAYYYEGNIIRAEHKFRELITTIPSSDYVNTATLWLGRTLDAANKFQNAQKELVALIPRAYENGERNIGGEAGLLLGQICLKLADSSGALSAFQTVIDQSHDDALKAQAQLSVAEILAVNGEKENVFKAFARVRDFNAELVTEYKARLRFAQYLVKIGRYDEAISELQFLLDRPEYSEYTAQIKYSQAYAFHQKGDITEAWERYVEIDSLYSRSDVAAQSYFQRGLIQQKDSGNYRTAMAMFEKARTEYPQSPITQKATVYAESMKQYVQLRTRIARCDSLLRYYSEKTDSTHKDTVAVDTAKNKIKIIKGLENPETAVDSLKIKTVKAAEMAAVEENKNTKETDSTSELKDSIVVKKDAIKITTKALENPETVVDSLKMKTVKVSGMAAVGENKNTKEMDSTSALIDSIIIKKDTTKTTTKVLKNPETVVDSLKMKTAKAAGMAAVRGIRNTKETDSTRALGDSIVVKKNTTAIIKAAVQDSIKVLGDRVAALYELGSLLYLELDEPDSAMQILKDVISNSPPDDIAAGSLFTIGQIYLTAFKNRKQTADSLSDSILVKYPTSKYAQEIRRQRGLPLLEISAEEEPHTLLLEAEKSLTKNDSETTFHLYKKIIEKHPKSEEALKARYAIGWFYENTYKNIDSAITWYNTLVKNFPTSAYAAKIKGKIDEVEAAKKKQDTTAATPKRSQVTTPSQAPAQTPARGDTARTTITDTLARRQAVPKQVDSVTTATKDSLLKRPAIRRRFDGDEDQLNRPEEKKVQPNVLTRPTGNIDIQKDTNKTVLPDSLLKKVSKTIDEEIKFNQSKKDSIQPDTLRH